MNNNRDCLEHLAKLADTEWGFYFKLKSVADMKKRRAAGEFDGASSINAMYVNSTAFQRADAIVRKWGRAMALKNAASTENLVKAIVVNKKREAAVAAHAATNVKSILRPQGLHSIPPGPPSATSASGPVSTKRDREKEKEREKERDSTASPPRKPRKPIHMRSSSTIQGSTSAPGSSAMLLPTDEKTIKGVTRFQAVWRGYVTRNDYKRRGKKSLSLSPIYISLTLSLSLL